VLHVSLHVVTSIAKQALEWSRESHRGGGHYKEHLIMRVLVKDILLQDTGTSHMAGQ